MVVSRNPRQAKIVAAVETTNDSVVKSDVEIVSDKTSVELLENFIAIVSIGNTYGSSSQPHKGFNTCTGFDGALGIPTTDIV